MSEEHETIENHYCKTTFKDKRSFIDHLKKSHETFKKKAHHRTNSEDNWIRHILAMKEKINEHLDTPTECSEIIGNYCRRCDKTFSEDNYFLDHMVTIHEGRINSKRDEMSEIKDLAVQEFKNIIKTVKENLEKKFMTEIKSRDEEIAELQKYKRNLRKTSLQILPQYWSKQRYRKCL